MAYISSSVTTVFKRSVTKMFLLLWVLFAVNCGGATPSQPTLTRINVDVDTTNLELANGSSKPVRVTGLYSDLSTKDITNDVEWTVDNTDVVKITAAGEIRVIGIGRANVTITDKNSGIKFTFPIVSVPASTDSGGTGTKTGNDAAVGPAPVNPGSTSSSTSTTSTQTSTSTTTTSTAVANSSTTTSTSTTLPVTTTTTSSSTSTTFLPSTTLTTSTTTTSSTSTTVTTTTSTTSTTSTTIDTNSGATCSAHFAGAHMLSCEKFNLIAGTKYRLSASVAGTITPPVHLQLTGESSSGSVCNTIYGPTMSIPTVVQCDFVAPNAMTISAGVESYYAYSGNFSLTLTSLSSSDVFFSSENRDDILANTDYNGTVSHNAVTGSVESYYEFKTPVANAPYKVIYFDYSNPTPMEVATGGIAACDPKKGNIYVGTDTVSGRSGYICDLHANGPIGIRISLDDDKYSDALYMPAMAAGGASYTFRIVPQPQP